MTTNSLLIIQLLTQASTGMGLAAGLSWLLEKSPRWAALEQEKKRLAYLGMVLVIALAAKFALNNVPDSAWQALEPYIQVVFAVLASWTTGTTLHTSTRAAEQITGLSQLNRSLIDDKKILSAHVRALAEIATKNTEAIVTRGTISRDDFLRRAGFSDEEIEKYGLATDS